MSNISYSLVKLEAGESFITVFDPYADKPFLANSDHPNWTKIIDAALNDSLDQEDLSSLFDPAVTVAKRFESLTERVSVAGGTVYFDGDPVDNALTQQIVRFLNEDVSDDGWRGLVNFFENVQNNPNEHSREQLYTWLVGQEFTIDSGGRFIGYKGVVPSEDAGVYRSINAGSAIRNGEVVSGTIPNAPGDVIEMPRSEVQHDPSNGCSTGLHVGTFDFAKSFGRGVVLEVRVNPRDVVSVPTGSSAQKLRCCRYEVVKAINVPYSSGYLRDDEDEYDEYDGWGEYDDDDED